MWLDDSPIASIENVDLFEMLTDDVFFLLVHQSRRLRVSY
jgi:hypothetical protein